MRVLLIDRDEIVAHKLRAALKSESYVCNWTTGGEDGVQIAKMYEFDIILLADVLTDLTGQAVLQHLRDGGVDTPVLFMSESDKPERKIDILDAGADDDLTKPVHPGEVIARINAIVRRAKGFSSPTVTVGPLTLNLSAKMVSVGGMPLPLSAKEYSLLELFALRRGKVVTRDCILNHLYDARDEPDAKIIDVYMCKVRKKIAAATGGETYINTVWGRGFVFDDMAVETAPAAKPAARAKKAA